MALWAVDCHVHLYEAYDIDLAVRSAWNNVKLQDGTVPYGQCWCLAAPPGTNGLDTTKLMVKQQSSKIRIVEIQDSADGNYVVLERSEGPILVVPGTQAISTEGLEVLSLGAELPSIGPTSLLKLVERVQETGGLPVVPWGVGKWFGRRGELVSQLLKGASPDDTLLLADNANRPWWWPLPKLLREATDAGRTVVSGSDPLPIRGDEARIASAGVYCSAESVATAWQQIRQTLLTPNEREPKVYGESMSSVRFWRNQVLIRVAAGIS